MPYLYVRHKVNDYGQWLKVFQSHEKERQEASFSECQILRDTTDPNVVVCFLKVGNIAEARAFTQTDDAAQIAVEAGVVGTPEATWLEEL